MFCKNCGKKIRDGISFCPHCGTQVAVNVEKVKIHETYSRYSIINAGYRPGLLGYIGAILMGIWGFRWCEEAFRILFGGKSFLYGAIGRQLMAFVVTFLGLELGIWCLNTAGKFLGLKAIIPLKKNVSQRQLITSSCAYVMGSAIGMLFLYPFMIKATGYFLYLNEYASLRGSTVLVSIVCMIIVAVHKEDTAG